MPRNDPHNVAQFLRSDRGKEFLRSYGVTVDLSGSDDALTKDFARQVTMLPSGTRKSISAELGRVPEGAAADAEATSLDRQALSESGNIFSPQKRTEIISRSLDTWQQSTSRLNSMARQGREAIDAALDALQAGNVEAFTRNTAVADDFNRKITKEVALVRRLAMRQARQTFVDQTMGLKNDETHGIWEAIKGKAKLPDTVRSFTQDYQVLRTKAEHARRADFSHESPKPSGRGPDQDLDHDGDVDLSYSPSPGP